VDPLGQLKTGRDFELYMISQDDVDFDITSVFTSCFERWVPNMCNEKDAFGSVDTRFMSFCASVP